MLATACIPWTEHWEVDEQCFRGSIAHRVGAGIRDLYLFGTAGEGYAVSDRQFERIATLFTDECRIQGIEPMVGVISLSAATVLERIERAMALGVRCVQISLPGWGTTTDTEARRFLDLVLGRFPEVSFLQYDLRRTGRLIDPSLYAAVAADHPNLVGTKNGTWDILRIRALLTDSPMLRHFLTEMGYPFGCSVGAPGLLMSLSSTNPPRGLRFFQTGVDGDLGTLLGDQGALVAIEAALEAAAGDTGAHMDGSFEKLLHRLHDDGYPLRMLPPCSAVTDEGFTTFRAWLAATHPEWAPGAG